MGDTGKGINTAHLREHGINQKENSRIFITYGRKDGLGLDDWIATAQAEGIIPKTDDAENYFIEALIEGKPIASEITLEQENSLADQEARFYYEQEMAEGYIDKSTSFESYQNEFQAQMEQDLNEIKPNSFEDEVYFQQADLFAQEKKTS